MVSATTGGATVSLQAERELGRRFDLAARQQMPLVSDPEIVGYVEEIGQKIAGTLEDSVLEYRFSVVRDPSINAFAVPGGYVYLHTGLLMRASSDDEVAAVLGHEIAHVHAHHIARQQEATQLMSYATLLAMLAAVVQPAIAPITSAVNAAVTLKYRREFEQEADYLGARYLHGTGYDPRTMLDFFRKLADDSRTQPTSVPPYLQSHPLTDERLNHLEAVLRTQQWAPRARPPLGFPLRRVQVLARTRTEPLVDVLKFYRRLVEEDPSDPMARYLFGVACLETGQLETAREALEMAQAAGVSAADRELGRVALRQRDPAKARVLLSSYLERDPGDAGAHAELAKALEVLGDREAAMAAYRRAFALAPRLTQAHYGFGILAGRAGNEVDGFYHLATAARLGGEYRKAIDQYARVLPLLTDGDPRHDEVRAMIAELDEFVNLSGRRTSQRAQPGPQR